MFKNSKNIFLFLERDERIKSINLIVFSTVISLLDAFGIASIMPFMAVLNNPSMLRDYSILISAMNFLAIEDVRDQVIFLGVLVFCLLIISLSGKAIFSYLQIRFVRSVESRMASGLMASFLGMPYEWFFKKNSSSLGKSILAEVAAVVHGGITPLFTTVSQAITVVAFTLLLMLIDLQVAITTACVFGFAYILIYLIMRNKMHRLGQLRFEANAARFLIISEAFGAIKEVKSGCLEADFSSSFRHAAKVQAEVGTAAQAITFLPRYILEALAFGGVLGIMTWLFSQADQENLLPLLAVYALAGYRLMPAIQQVYAGVTQLNYIGAGIESLARDMQINEGGRTFEAMGSDVIQFSKQIDLKRVCYRYPGNDTDSLKNVSLRIPSGATVGIVGLTGSGKTTLVDVMLGLLKPSSGSIFIDNVSLEESSRLSWTKLVGYVPQKLYLSDASISRNVGFGSASIDQDRVIRSCKLAQIHEFVMSLPDGYDTVVGERGVRLSGGQCQRIGLARALYRNPRILILDEATSALDNLTEKDVITAINHVEAEGITTITIAHRLSTVRHCSMIIFMKSGAIEAIGTFDDLFADNIEFRRLASSSVTR
jgi:ABC-type bacteriocin/lantibiotic exporter with double-glycine peptidase domain